MSDEIIKFGMPSDQDGFVSFECPFCGDRFKLRVDEVEDDSVINLFCPYCGLQDEPIKFISHEGMEQAQILAENLAKSMINDFFGKMESRYRGNKNITFKVNKKLEMTKEKPLFEIESEMDLINLECCKRQVKTKYLEKEVYCPYCGVK